MYALQLIVDGLELGGVIGLLSVGLSLIFGTSNIINFAQADFMMLGMYAVILAYGVARLDYLVLTIVMIVPSLIVGYVVYQVVIRPLGRAVLPAGGRENSQLLATLGISLVLENGMQMVVGSNPVVLRSARSIGAIHLDGIVIDEPRAIAFVVAVAAVLAVMAVTRHTGIGRLVRAASEDPVTAAYLGVPVQRVLAAVFAVAIMLACVAGGVLAGYYPAQPTVGQNFIVLMFAAVVLGGLGSVGGAFLASLLLGVVDSASALVLPLQLSMVSVFVIFMVVMLVKPQGIFGVRERV